MNTAGYSATPLAKKLGIKDGHVVRLVNTPDNYFSLLTDMPVNIKITKDKKTKKHFIHYFTQESTALSRDIPALKNEIVPDGMIWISWPKKTSKVVTDVTEEVIRKIAIANGLVDVKVCAIDETWSGLKLVIPVKYRKK
ncbi:MAG: DUF3052 domain-containing protein [Bacteroidota bacterium]